MTISSKKNLCSVFLLPFFLLITALGPTSRAQVTLAENGHTSYTIIIPSNAAFKETKAASTLSDCLGQISGARFPVFTDEESRSETEIIIGKSIRLEQEGLKLHLDKIDYDGFIIMTAGNRLVIAGPTPEGTLNGVYTFLEDYLGCRMYTPDVTRIPKRGTISLGKIKDIREPVFTFREPHFPGKYDRSFVEWHKLHTHHTRSFGLWVHTFDDLVPPKKYFDEHPEYFSEINGARVPNGQVCLTNPKVFDILVDNLRKRMGNKPEATFWSVSQNDNFLACQCDNCTAAVEKSGSQSALMVDFVNRVAAIFPDKTISTLAYQYTRTAPKGIKPLPNVNIMLCSIECNRSLPLEEDPSSASFVNDVRQWSKLTDNILIWDYVVQFRNYISPFPNLHVLQPNLAFFADKECRMMFQQGSGKAHSDFSELKTYLIAKLLWDPYADARMIMEDFMAGYYGGAAPFLLDYIDLLQNSLDGSGDNLWIYGYPYDGIDSYLKPDLIPQYELLFDQAEEAVADDPAVLSRVQKARLPLEFAIMDISLHRETDDLSWVEQFDGKIQAKQDMLDRLDLFTERCDKAGISMLNEIGTTPADYQLDIRKYLVKNTESHLALGKPVTLHTEYSPKYDAGGAAALTDGRRGIDDYHFNWLGFEGDDLEAVIDMGEEMQINRVSADFLQDIRSWIFLPKSLEVEYSIDGATYTFAGKDFNIVPNNKTGTFIQTFTVSMPDTRIRYIRVRADALKTCPEWHLGKGKNSWIFIDEIVVE